MDPTTRNRLDFDDGEVAPRDRLRAISLLPSAATLGNLFCGLLAILCCLLEIRDVYFDGAPRTTHPRLAELFPTYVSAGAYLVVLAMVFDALDGRLARMVRRTSEFGAQLDSMADVVSFGAAPAMLFITLLLRLAVPSDGGEVLVSKLQWRLGMLCALVYVGCAAIRLARYNAENVKDESAQNRFSGLPVPGAAAALVALLVLHEDLARSELIAAAGYWTGVIRWTAAPIAFALGILMVSRLDYPHVFNLYFRRQRPPIHLVWLLVAALIAYFSPEVLLVLLAYAYLIGGLVVYWRRRGQTPAPVQLAESEIHQDVN